MSDNDEPEPRRVAIEDEIRSHPWKTQEQIAEATGASRSWVGDILADDESLAALRNAYRRGISFEASTRALEHIAHTAGVAGVDDTTVDRLFASAERGDEVANVHVELELEEDLE